MSMINDVSREIPLNDVVIVSNTRTEFDEPGLKELAQSIKANGVIQSILVRPAADGKYELICGERRVRSSFLAGKTTIPARIVDVPDKDLLTIKIIENMQRKDISLMDQVRAVVDLREKQSMTDQEISKSIGRSSSAIGNYFKIAKSAPELHSAIEKKQVSRAVALVVASIEDPDNQIKAVNALKRDNSAYLVTKKDAEIFVSKSFGAQSKPTFKTQSKNAILQGRFASDWKYYLVRFSAWQFEKWQGIVRLKTDTDTLANAVEMVMRETNSAHKLNEF